MYYPHVIEKTGRSEKPIDLPSRLLQDRIIYLNGGVNDESAHIAIMQMLWLNADNPDEDINLYINSYGGSVYAGLAIKDIMDSLQCKVNTLGVGFCASMGAYLLASGTGSRRATKNCRVMIHSVSSGTSPNIHDMKIDYMEAQYLQDKMINHIHQFTKGKTSLEEMTKLCERDKYLSPEECIEIGLVDSIV